MKTIFLYTLILFICNASAQTYLDQFTVEIEPMEKFLGEVKDIKQFPKFSRVTRAVELDANWGERCTIVSNQKVIDIFKALKAEFFTNIPIPLYSCNWDFDTGTLLEDGIFLSSLNSIDLDSEDSLAGLKFTLAHEIAHYTHELSTMRPYSKTQNYSINGYPSYTLIDIEECLSIERQDDRWECDNSLWTKGHSEVDIYAAIVLKRLGFNNWDGARKNWIEKIKVQDLEGEQRVIERVNERFDIMKSFLKL